MREFVIILIGLLFFCSCEEKTNKGLFPSIKSTKTTDHIRVKGSKVYAIIPEEYTYSEDLSQYSKNEKLYIQIIEVKQSFEDIKPQFTEAGGSKFKIIENITLNEYDAIYVESSSIIAEETKMNVLFGDESFNVFVVGFCKTGDIEGKEELQQIFKTLYYDKEHNLDHFELANFEFDLSILEYKHAMSMSNMFVYTKNGEEDEGSSLVFSVLPKMSGDEAESYLKDLLQRYESKGNILNNKQVKKEKLGEYDAFVLETDYEMEDEKGALFQAVLLGENRSVVVLGNTVADLNEMMQKFKKTTQSIKIK